ncbi:MAG: hypothetical protein PHR77_14765 [Kiritimatiellae bacterium]|nr:hypothetical protein [Kiritimatiellia bacterium]MDD5520681.1 hypothetical protein [Kiritimatiellia bacterium]
MHSYNALIKCSMVLTAVCILFCGCTDKKRIAELEQTNQALESRVAKLDSDLTLASNALRAKQAEAANLQSQLAGIQAKMVEAEKSKPAVTKKATTGTKTATTAKKGTTTAKKSTSPKVKKAIK